MTDNTILDYLHNNSKTPSIIGFHNSIDVQSIDNGSDPTAIFELIKGVDKNNFRTHIESTSYDFNSITYQSFLRFEDGKTQVDMFFKPGVTLIMGDSATGKTTLIDKILVPLLKTNLTLIKFREPDAVIYDERLLYPRLIFAKTPIIACDGLRDFFFEESKSTGAGGVNNLMFSYLGFWQAYARASNKHFIFTLNPSSSTAEAMAAYFKAGMGAVDQVIETKQNFMLSISSRFASDRGIKDVSYKNPYDISNSQKRRDFEKSVGLYDFIDGKHHRQVFTASDNDVQSTNHTAKVKDHNDEFVNSVSHYAERKNNANF